MRKLSVFNHLSLDGFFTDATGDMRWAHRDDPEYKAFVQGNAGGGGELVFGRLTYEMMASYWPTPHALENDPVVAKEMNDLPKVVFSRTLKNAPWSNTRLIKGDLVQEVQKLKEETGKDLVIFGSGTIISQLAQAGLIDEYQIVVVPVVLGKGRTMFATVENRVPLKLTKSRVFGNGYVFLCYQPVT